MGQNHGQDHHGSGEQLILVEFAISYELSHLFLCAIKVIEMVCETSGF